MKDLAYYKALPYTRQVVRKNAAGHFYFVAEYAELDGIFGTGDTRSEAINQLNLMFDDGITGLLDMGAPIPEPVHPNRRIA